MSGIYIPNMKMPTSCGDCRFCGDYCYAKGDENKYSKLPCPLVPIPPHGGLIDADALLANLPAPIEDEYKYVRRIVKNTPTIIPASEEGET